MIVTAVMALALATGSTSGTWPPECQPTPTGAIACKLPPTTAYELPPLRMPQPRRLGFNAI